MKYDEPDKRDADPTPTTIVINCTRGEKNRIIKAAQREGSKIAPWSLSVLLEISEQKSRPLILD